MASRVNMKFVVLLGAGLVVLAGGVAFLGVRAMNAGGEQQIQKGDEAMAANDLDKAIMYYSRAVNKDQRNGPWIRKWIGALEKYTPPTRQKYSDIYFQQYLGALAALTEAERTSLEPFERLFEERYQLTVAAPSLGGWEQYASFWEDRMKSFQGSEKDRNALRRYRGLARYGQLQANPEVRVDVVEGAIEDLKASLGEKPKDEEAAVALSRIELQRGEKSLEAGRTAEGEALIKASKDRIAAFVQANPDAQRARFDKLAIEIAESMRTAPPGTLVIDIFKQKKDEIRAFVNQIKAIAPDKTEPSVVLALDPFVRFGVDDGGTVADDLIEHARKGHSTDALFLLGLSRLEQSRGNVERSIELAEAVVKLPDMPVSRQGLLMYDMRAQAVKMQADAAFLQWEIEKDAAKKTQWVTRIQQLRKDLADRVGEGAPALGSIDGRLALVNNDIAGARVLITNYNDQTQRSDVAMLMIEAQLFLRTGQRDAAKKVYERVLQLDKQNFRANLAMGQIEAEASNYKEALPYLAIAMAARPDLPELKKFATNVEGMARGSLEDPVLELLRRAQEMAKGLSGDVKGAIKILQGGIAANPKDIRLPAAIARLQMQIGESDAAKQTIDDAIARMPENEQLKRTRASLDKDPLQAIVESIDQSAQPEVTKNLQKYDLYMRNNKPEDAKRFLDQAKQAAPEDPMVFEATFVDAAFRKDDAELERIVREAQRMNVDKVGGMIYVARRHLLNNKLDDAIGALTDVTKRDKLNLQGWRLLGISLLEAKKPLEAVDALRTAVGIKSDDLATVNAYIKALVLSNQAADALAIARKMENNLGGDPEFQEMILNLESNAPGGDINRAILARQRIAERTPGNRNNRTQLASLLINANRFDEARKLVDDLRKEQPEDPVGNELEVGLTAKRGDIPGAVQKAKAFIDALPKEKRKDSLYVNVARLILQMGLPEQAIATLEEGRDLQDPKTAIIDREIGDLSFNTGRLDRAIKAYEAVLAGGGDDSNNAVRLRLVECYLSLKKFPEMDKAIQALPKDAQADATVILLQAEAAAAQNDREKALRLYDQAVTAAPKNPICYLKRGDYKALDPRMVKDAEADYEQIIRIQPNNIQGMVRLVKIMRMTGRDEAAVQMLRRAVTAEPFNENLRLAMPTLLEETGRMADAAAAYEEAVKQFNGAITWRSRAAGAFGRIGRWDKAVEHLSFVWRERKNPEITASYVDALINNNDAATAWNVLQVPEIRVDQNLALRMLRGRVLAKQGRTADAAKELSDALTMVNPQSRESVNIFTAGLSSVYPKLEDQIKALRTLESRGKFAGYLGLRFAEFRLRQPESRAEALQAIEAIANNDTASVRGAAWALLGTLSYQEGNWAKSKEQFVKGLEFDNKNAELNNNLAYIMAVKLKQCDEALAYAQAAVDMVPQNSGFLDTLGAVLLCKNDCAGAARVFQEGLNKALNDGERLPLYIHMGRARLCAGDKVEAKRLSGIAKEVMLKIPQELKDQYTADLQDLDQAIDAK